MKQLTKSVQNCVEPELALPLIEPASWVMASELVRRAPDRLRLIETHPGGGQYDCLSVMSDQRHLCAFNRRGRLHFFTALDGQQAAVPPMTLWSALQKGESSLHLLNTISQHLRIPVPSRLPPGTSESLTYRVIGAFLKLTIFGLSRWQCANGFYDTSGEGGGTVKDFALFPGAEERRRQHEPGDLFSEPAYRFWFLRRDDAAQVCIETTGTVWFRDGSTVNLAKVYGKNRRLTSAIAALAEKVLPTP